MPCKPFDFWNPVPAGSSLCAKVSATNGDFVARVVIMDADGGGTTFGKSSLVSGPICFPLESRGYGITGTVGIGDDNPTVTLNIFVKGNNGDTLFESNCEFSGANKSFNVSITVVPA
jgi:hypothetical protein